MEVHSFHSRSTVNYVSVPLSFSLQLAAAGKKVMLIDLDTVGTICSQIIPTLRNTTLSRGKLKRLADEAPCLFTYFALGGKAAPGIGSVITQLQVPPSLKGDLKQLQANFSLATGIPTITRLMGVDHSWLAQRGKPATTIPLQS